MKSIDELKQIEGKNKQKPQASTGGRMRRYSTGSKMFSLSIVIFFGLFLPSVVDGSSFFQDVVKTKKSSATTQQQILNDKLLSKAVPLTEYRKRMNDRHLDYDYYYNYANNDDGDDQAHDDDDYYVNEDNYLNFDGYSLKYAKCQPVQRFSQSAVEAGEYSPMVINDIVIMRLCPSQYCSSSRDYGCGSNFVEYAIELTDYIRIMLRYKIDKKEQLCDWCDSCAGNNRRQRRASSNYYYYTDEDGNLQRGERNDDANNGGDDYVAYDDAAAAAAASACDNYDTYCLNEYGNSICNDNDDDGGGNNGGDDDYNDNDNSNSMSPDEYLEIIDCVQLDGGYFIRPRCDAYSETLSMGIYYDRFCSSYAGNEVNIANFDLGIDQSYFQEFGENAGCLDCSESVS
ncbi:MAG: hypothetical protein ACI90V_013511 [Bacillariaceae sp.]|jgi:hypothetical protein